MWPGGVVSAAPGEITFFCGSDLHYGAVTATNSAAEIARTVIHQMNALPGQPFPTPVGGVVGTPRGVLLAGDLTDGAVPTEWLAFTNDWGMKGDRLLAFPIFEGFGNHDLATPATAFVRDAIKARNRVRPGLSGISPNGYHYSFDWDFLHLVCLNLFPGDAPATNFPGLDPQHSLGFLKDDLARHVKHSNRPVMVYHHYGFDHDSSLGWWTERQREEYYDALRNYNVIAILAAHNHGIGVNRWHGIDTFSDGTIGKFAGNFLVVRVTHTNLAIIEHTLANSWGRFVYQQPIQTPPDKK